MISVKTANYYNDYCGADDDYVDGHDYLNEYDILDSIKIYHTCPLYYPQC